MSASTSRPTTRRPESRRSRPLFHRPDGVPYDFWIQPTLDLSITKLLTDKITDNGGHIWDFKRDDMLSHGFLLIDPYDVAVLHQVKTSFHKPVAAAATTFAFRSSVPPTPLRHVLSYKFVHAVVDQGHWNRHDLKQWGWPVFFNTEDMVDMEGALKRFHLEMRKDIDRELERGWIWATGSVFYAADYNYDYKEELDEIDDALNKEVEKLKNQSVDNRHKDGRASKKWVSGRVVALYRRANQTKFYLHEDISASAKREAIRTIMAEGGACCYDHENADVLLIGSTPDQFYDDLDISKWLENPPHKEDNQPQKLKFVSWVYSCTIAGSVSEVNPKIHDVFITNQNYQAQLQAQVQAQQQAQKLAGGLNGPQASARVLGPSPAPSSSFIGRPKGKQTTTETPNSTLRAHPDRSTRSNTLEQSVSTVQKRRLDAVEPSTPFNLGNSPFKKRKVQATGNETNQSLDASSTIQATATHRTRINQPSAASSTSMSIFPGSVSTIKPKRIFDGVAVPILPQPSPLARVTKPTDASYIIAKNSSFEVSDSEKSDQLGLEVDELDDDSVEARPNNDARAPERQHSPDIFGIIPKYKPRISAVSASSSKLDNTTTTNATTLTSRSVGPAPPPNAKQVPQNSTSTGTIDITRSSLGSRGGYGIIDGIDSQHSQFSQNASGSGFAPLVRSSSLRDAHIDEYDREGEKILEQFDPADAPEEEVHIRTLRSDDEDAVAEGPSRENAEAEVTEKAEDVEREEEADTMKRRSLSPWERKTVAFLREMKRWNDVGGLQIVNSLRESWAQRLREIQETEAQDKNTDPTQEKAELVVLELDQGGEEYPRRRKGRGKGRVSFHEPLDDRNQDDLVNDDDEAKDKEFEEHVKEQERSSSSLLRGLSMPRRRTSSLSPEPLPEPSPEFLRVTPSTSRKPEEAELGIDEVEESELEENVTEKEIKQEWVEEKGMEGLDREDEGIENEKAKATIKGKTKSASTTATKAPAETLKPHGKAPKQPTRKQQEQQKKLQGSRLKSREFPSDEEVDELEDDDQLGPLPSLPESLKPAKKPRAKRGASVVSDDDVITAAPVFVLRRGRSASLPPAEPVVSAPSVASASRKPPSKMSARKTTGGHKPRKR